MSGGTKGRKREEWAELTDGEQNQNEKMKKAVEESQEEVTSEEVEDRWQSSNVVYSALEEEKPPGLKEVINREEKDV